MVGIRWRRRTVFVGLLLVAWAALAVWQYHEYGHECESIRESFNRQAKSVMNALVGGIQSHCPLGRVYPGQLQQVFNQLVAAENVLAAGVTSETREVVLAAGGAELLDLSPPITPGMYWEAEGLRYVAEFHLNPAVGIKTDGTTPCSCGDKPCDCAAKQARTVRQDPQVGGNGQTQFVAEGTYTASLLMDRTDADAACQRAGWLRTWVVLAGGVVFACVGRAWLARVRIMEAHVRARLLEVEAQHLRDFAQAAAGLAHETRNPLGLIRGWAQMLGDPGLHLREQRQRVQSIIEECDRMASRITKFLAFAKPNEPVLATVDLTVLFDELALLLKPDLETKSLVLEYCGSGPERVAQADREMLRQALFNLIRNAIHFAPERSRIDVTVAPGENGYRRIEVADRGPGVSPEKVHCLFTPYFTTRADGTGLGLAIVRRIAAAHGWQSGYTPRPSGGSIFWLEGIHG
jgi:two-component system, NtrC family, sensor histidine kinase HydH